MPSNRLLAALAVVFLAALAWSVVRPHDYLTWALEASPAIAAFVLLAATYRRFPLTPLAYVLVTIHAVILVVGAHYTYARVPAGDWLREALNLSRNHYDRLGHFVQGFVPAIVAREVLVRASPLRGSKWLPVLVVCVCLAISALYELVEWAVAVVGGASAEAFLATQGDEWDTQKDMAMALLGALAALVLLSRLHDRQLEGLRAEGSRPNADH
jgi:putative membrane protein